MANQQLPPFDWHYLFGYTTVLLVALQLAFNFPMAWRYLTRPPGAAPAALAIDHQHAASGRRRWLSTLGVLLTAGTALVLGMCHGRSDFRVEWPMATLNKSLAARSALFWAVCGVANRRHSGAMAVVVRLAAHPKPGRPHSRGLVQHGPKANGTYFAGYA